MAEREKIPNKERRARAREERRRAEAEAAERQQSLNWRRGLIVLAVAAVIGAVLFQAFLGGPGLGGAADGDGAQTPVEELVPDEGGEAPDAEDGDGDDGTSGGESGDADTDESDDANGNGEQ